MYMSQETRKLITLVRFRIEALLEAELAENPSTRDIYRRVSQQNVDDSAFVAALGEEVQTLISSTSDVSIALAPRLCPVVAGLFWTQVTDQLIERTNCDFKNFGEFVTNRPGGLLRVSFTSSPVLSHNSPPELQQSPFQVENVAEQLSHKVLLPIREQFSRRPDFGYTAAWQVPLVVTAILTRGLPKLWAEMASVQLGVVPESQGFVSSIAMVTSFAAYFAWTAGLGIHMSLWPELAVEGLGSLLRNDSGVVEFQASAEFRKLLDINIPRAEGLAA
jgi:hypothetical protein